MATHSSVLTWRIPWIEEPGRLQSIGPHRGMKVNVAQSCPTLCNPMNYTVHGILQARILEWVTTKLLSTHTRGLIVNYTSGFFFNIHG